jgi:hypothetical protein
MHMTMLVVFSDLAAIRHGLRAFSSLSPSYGDFITCVFVCVCVMVLVNLLVVWAFQIDFLLLGYLRLIKTFL